MKQMKKYLIAKKGQNIQTTQPRGKKQKGTGTKKEKKRTTPPEPQPARARRQANLLSSQIEWTGVELKKSIQKLSVVHWTRRSCAWWKK
jgi:hypothetical protein